MLKGAELGQSMMASKEQHKGGKVLDMSLKVQDLKEGLQNHSYLTAKVCDTFFLVSHPGTIQAPTSNIGHDLAECCIFHSVCMNLRFLFDTKIS